MPFRRCGRRCAPSPPLQLHRVVTRAVGNPAVACRRLRGARSRERAPVVAVRFPCISWLLRRRASCSFFARPLTGLLWDKEEEEEEEDEVEDKGGRRRRRVSNLLRHDFTSKLSNPFRVASQKLQTQHESVEEFSDEASSWTTRTTTRTRTRTRGEEEEEVSVSNLLCHDFKCS